MSGELTSNIEENISILNKELRVDVNFDILNRVFEIGGRKCCFYFVDGFVKDEVMQKLMQVFQGIKEEQMADTAQKFLTKFTAYGEVDLIWDKEEFVKSVLSGVPCLVVDGYSEIISMDFRTYPARSVDEPDKDKVLRGSKDGFVETIVFNTALIRRRIRSKELTMEIVSVGSISKTDVVISYMNDRVDRQTLNKIREKIQKIHVDALAMNSESLAECLFQRHWYNPFPKFKFTERPDTTAASILEGGIAVMVDSSPSAILLPTSLFDIMEEANDYYFPPLTGTYLRLSRYLIDLIALILTPLFVLLTSYPQWIPAQLDFIRITDPINIPIVYQFLLLELSIDGLRMASINTPSILSTPLSVLAAIVLGDYTVSSGWFNSECMLYMAFVTIANYSQASLELGYAVKFMRILLLLLTGWFGIWGFTGGLVLNVAFLVMNKTFPERSYLYPLIPFNRSEIAKHFLRLSLPRAEEKENHK